MTNRTLVYMIFRTDCISLRTVSRIRKSPHCFYISRSRLEELEHAGHKGRDYEKEIMDAWGKAKR